MSAVVRRMNSRPLATPFSLGPSFAEKLFDEEKGTVLRYVIERCSRGLGNIATIFRCH